MHPTATFSIRETDFGIDSARSFWRVTSGATGELLTLEVRGDSAAYERIRTLEPWSWTLYPPYLYVRDFPLQCSAEPHELGVARIEEADLDDYDVALYLSEHWDITNVRICVGQQSLHVAGSVAFFSDAAVPFKVTWTRSD